MKPKHAVLLTLLLLLPMVASAQLRVVKDNINCAYGLKDPSGNWVVPPIYVLIEDMQGAFFKTHTLNKQGVLDLSGKRLIPDDFNHISWRLEGFFTCTDEHQQVGYNRRGKQIFAGNYSQCLEDQKGRFLLYRDSANQVYSTYLDTSGRVLIPEMQGKIDRFFSKTYSTITNASRSAYQHHTKVGLLDLKGNMLVPMEYSAISICSQGITLIQENKTIFLDLKLDTIQAFEFRLHYLLSTNGDVPCFENQQLFQFWHNGKWGIVNQNGEIILAAEYERFESPNHGVKRDLILMRKSGKVGLLSSQGKVLCDAIYDSIGQLFIHQSYEGLSKFMIVKSQGKYGLISSEGKVVLKPAYSKYFRDFNAPKKLFFFGNGLDLIAFDPSSDSLQLIPVSFKKACDHIRLYSCDNNLFPFLTDPGKHQLISLGCDYGGYQKRNGLLKISTNAGTYVFTEDGKLWGGRKVVDFDLYSGIVSTSSKSKGLVNLRNKNLILDTVFQEINTGYLNQNMIWVQIPKKQVWMLYDSVGKLRLKEAFDRPFFFNPGQKIIPVHVAGYKGIMNSDYQWILPPAFKWISAISKDLYVVQNKNHHFGVLNGKQQVILETVYKDFEALFEDVNAYHVKNNDFENYYLFRKDSSELVFSSKGVVKNFPTTLEKKQFLSSLAFKARFNCAASAFKIMATARQDSIIGLSPYRTDLYDTIRKQYDSLRPLPIENPYDQQNRHILGQLVYFGPTREFSVLDAGSKFCSLVINDPQMIEDFAMSMSIVQPIYRDYLNYIWNDGALKAVQFSDVFGSGDLLKNEVISAIQARDDLELDCSNMDVLLAHFGKRFSLSKKGILLYYDPNNYGYQQIEILIPIERLALQEESRWLVDYLR